MAIVHVGEAGLAGSSVASPQTITYSSTTGNTLIITGHLYDLNNNAFVAPTSITDTAGNTWQVSTNSANTPLVTPSGSGSIPPTASLLDPDDGATSHQSDWVAWSVGAAHVTSVTVAWAGAVTTFARVALAEYSGVVQFDNSWAGGSATAGASGSVSAALTVHVTGELAVGAVDFGGAGTPAIPTGWTQNTSSGGQCAFLIGPSVGAFAPTWTDTVAGSYTGAAALFSPVSLGAPVQLPQRQRFKRIQTLQQPTPAPPSAVAVPAPPQLPPIRRRLLARAVVRGSAPFLGFVAVPAPHQPPYLPPRRTPGRVAWRGSRPFLGFVAVPAPRQQPAPAPRRRPGRAYVQFTPVRTTNGAGAQISGTLQPRATVPIPRRQPRQRAYIQFAPVTTVNKPQILPPSGVVPFAQGAPGGDRPPEIRMFRSVMPGEIPATGHAMPRLQGRGYAAPPPARAEDIDHLWEEPAPPAEPPGPTPAEIVLGEAQRAAGALYDLGKILAPEPYVPPSKARCGAIRKLGTETLRCTKKRGHPGMHADRGVRWG